MSTTSGTANNPMQGASMESHGAGITKGNGGETGLRVRDGLQLIGELKDPKTREQIE